MKRALLCFAAVSLTVGEDPFACCQSIKAGEPVPVGGLFWRLCGDSAEDPCHGGGRPIKKGFPFTGGGNGVKQVGIFCEGTDAKDQLAGCVSMEKTETGDSGAPADGFTYFIHDAGMIDIKDWVQVTPFNIKAGGPKDGWSCANSSTDAFGDCKKGANNEIPEDHLIFVRADRENDVAEGTNFVFQADKEVPAPHDGLCCGCGVFDGDCNVKSSGTVGRDSFIRNSFMLGAAAVCLVEAVWH